MTRFAVLDATVLTNFALVNRSDLIDRLWARIAVTTTEAMREYQAGVIFRRFVLSRVRTPLAGRRTGP